MGRTKRRRAKKRNEPRMQYLDEDRVIINLMQWMSSERWDNSTRLRLAHFPDTERGAFSTCNIKRGQPLLEIPFELMISLITLEKSSYFRSVLAGRRPGALLSICDLLAVFVVLEEHRGALSPWRHYIASLPAAEALRQIWLCSDEELEHVPAELRPLAERERRSAADSADRVFSALRLGDGDGAEDGAGDARCGHCGRPLADVVTRARYAWGYVVVNTRCVYVCPDELGKLSSQALRGALLDAPNSALCPFMDMINHSDTSTSSYFASRGGALRYGLEAGSPVPRYREIFISYGAYDNRRLAAQYGFVLPRNRHDSVLFTLQEILAAGALQASARQYRFLQRCKLDARLSIDERGYSFGLAAALYVLTHGHEHERHWPQAVYSFRYSAEQTAAMDRLAAALLRWKLRHYAADLERVRARAAAASQHFRLAVGYAASRVDLAQRLLRAVLDKQP